MGRYVGTGTVPSVIVGAAAALAIAIFGRAGSALEPQRAAAGAPRSASSSPAPTQSAKPVQPAAARAAARVDYEREIKPILSENCLECHSQDKRKGGLSLANYDDVLDGGKDGAVVR